MLSNFVTSVADEMEKSDQRDTSVETRNQLALKVSDLHSTCSYVPVLQLTN